MLHMFCQTSQFQAVIIDCALPPDLNEWYPILDCLVASSYQGSLDVYAGNLEGTKGFTTLEKQSRTSRLTEPELEAARRRASPLPKFEHCGTLHLHSRNYIPVREDETHSFRKGRNGSITFKDAQGNHIVGRIRRIIRTIIRSGQVPVSDSNTFVFIEEYKPLSGPDSTRNPYRLWPDLQTTMVYNSFTPQFNIIALSQIVGLVARCLFVDEEAFGITAETIVMVSLERVSPIPMFPNPL